MGKKLHLIIALIAISTNIALGATTVTPGNIGEITLAGETEVIVTGEWDNTTLGTLKTKLGPARSTLTTVNMADAMLTGDIPNGINEMFWGFQSLTTVTLPTAGHDGEVSFESTFAFCRLLKTVENLEEFTKISNMFGTFQTCEALTSIILPQGTSAGSIDFGNTFSGCTLLETIENLEEFTNISNMHNMFHGCEALTSITLPQGTTAESIDFGSTFSDCIRLETIENLDKFTNISNMEGTFSGCAALTAITLPQGTTAESIDFGGTFRGCTRLETIENLEEFTKISSMQGTFENCAALTAITLPQGTTADIPDGIGFDYTFTGCTRLGTIENLEEFTKISNMHSTFENCAALTSVTLPQGTTAQSWFGFSLENAFRGCTLLETIENLDKFTKITSMSYAFSECTALTAITLPQGSTAENTDFEGTFSACTRLETIENLDKFTKIMNMRNAFQGCAALTSVILPQGTTAIFLGDISFEGTFSGCIRLETVENLEEFTNINSMNYTFLGCEALTSITLSSVPTNNYNFTFYGANPNCLKYINNASFNNSTYRWTNVILPSGLDGSWQALNDIVLDGTKCFGAAEAFTMADGKTITYTMGITDYKTTKANGEITPAWGTICLPFDALLAHPDKEGVYMRAYNGEQGDYWLRTFESSEEPGVVTFAHAYNGSSEDHTDIKANIPYIISFPGTGWEEGEGITATKVTFIAAAGSIAATPQGGITAGEDNYLFRTDFKPRSDTDTDDLYVLDTENSIFKKSSGLPLGAFDVYFADAVTGFSGKRSLSIGGGTGDGTITAIRPVLPGSNPGALKVYRDGQGALRIESDRAMQVVLYSINGTAVRTLTLKEGSNYVNGLEPGMYIIERQKAIVF